jgi:hypothetical protein
LNDHFSSQSLIQVARNRRPFMLVVVINKSSGDACPRFNDNLKAGLGQLSHVSWNQRYATFAQIPLS